MKVKVKVKVKRKVQSSYIFRSHHHHHYSFSVFSSHSPCFSLCLCHAVPVCHRDRNVVFQSCYHILSTSISPIYLHTSALPCIPFLFLSDFPQHSIFGRPFRDTAFALAISISRSMTHSSRSVLYLLALFRAPRAIQHHTFLHQRIASYASRFAPGFASSLKVCKVRPSEGKGRERDTQVARYA